MESPRNKMFKLVILSVFCLFILPSFVYANTCTSDDVEIRREAKSDSESLGKLNKSDSFTLLGIESEWMKIKKGDIEGYVINTFIIPSKNAVVQTNDVNVRKEPNIESKVEKVLTKGNEIAVTEVGAEWYSFVENGVTYYIYKTHVSPINGIYFKRLGLVIVDEPEVNAMVTGNNVNVRNAANTTSNIVTKKNTGDRIFVLEEKDGFYAFYHNNEKVWIVKTYVNLYPDVNLNKEDDSTYVQNEENKALDVNIDEESTTPKESNATITGNSVNIRSESRTGSAVIAKKNSGDRIYVIELVGDWYNIELDGKSLWVNKSYVSLDEAAKVEDKTDSTTNASVFGTNVNIRKEPKTSASIITKKSTGTRLNVKEMSGEWYSVEIDGVIGWISKNYVRLDEGVSIISTPLAEQKEVIVNSYVEENDGSYVYVNAATGLNLREAASSDSTRIGKLDNRTKLELIEELDKWYKIKTPSGTIGYVSKDYITDKPVEIDDDLRLQIVAYAKQFLGTPYVYGGNSLTKGVDCSGFTSQVMSNFGITLNRVSRDQVKNGTVVNKSELMPGDLVFFATMGGSTISHVGIYIGDSKFIHSTSERNVMGVAISDLNSSYYIRTYKTAARVL